MPFRSFFCENVPKESTYFFEENNIPYGVMEINEMEEDKKRNYLVRDDFKNIKEQNIDYLKLSTCIDGYNHCLPFIEFFELYDLFSFHLLAHYF